MSREEDRETLEKFFNCVKEKNYQDIEEAYKAVCQMPKCNSYDDQYHTYGKGYYIDERIYPTEDNIDFHPYIKGYYDMAVTEQMGWDRFPADLRRIKKFNDSADFDGNRELVFFLNNYRYLKDTLEKQGKEIFRPDSFDKYPFLEDYVKGIFRDGYDRVTQDASQCKTISELIKNKDAVKNYCNAGVFVYNPTEYWYNIERKHYEWGEKKWREIYDKAENETFKQGNIADLTDEEKEFIIVNTKNKDRAVEVGKTLDDAFLRDSSRILNSTKADIIYAKAEKPEKLSDADKEFILKNTYYDEIAKSVANVYDFKAQSSEKLYELLVGTVYKKIGKDIAKEYIDSCKGVVAYGDLISKVLTEEEFDQAVEGYKITSYKRDNERLKAENAQMKEDVTKEWEKIKQENDKILTTKGKLQQERNEVAEETARVRAKSAEIAFIKDIDKVNKNGPDEFDTNRKKELFAKMKEEMLKNPNLREGHLAAMCKIYASKTNTPEQKAEYFEGLHEVRKSGTTNAEKREMARTFGRVLERNPELAKDEALKGLAKIDYSAVGYTPTQVGFLKNQKQTTK